MASSRVTRDDGDWPGAICGGGVPGGGAGFCCAPTEAEAASTITPRMNAFFNYILPERPAKWNADQNE